MDAKASAGRPLYSRVACRSYVQEVPKAIPVEWRKNIGWAWTSREAKHQNTGTANQQFAPHNGDRCDWSISTSPPGRAATKSAFSTKTHPTGFIRRHYSFEPLACS